MKKTDAVPATVRPIGLVSGQNSYYVAEVYFGADVRGRALRRAFARCHKQSTFATLHMDPKVAWANLATLVGAPLTPVDNFGNGAYTHDILGLPRPKESA